jgi:heavy metal sensor kinase
MKPSLTVKYLGWLLLFMLVCFLLNFGIDELHDKLIVGPERHEPVGEEVQEFFFILMLNMAAAPIVLLIGWLIARRMIKPIGAISRTAQEITAGKMKARVETKGKDELALLAQSLNAAFDRYDHAIDRLRRFSSDASHQLRTPLTAIRSKGEVALQRARSVEEYQRVIQDMLEQVEQLSRIVEQLLDLSRMEAVARKESLTAVDLTEVVTKAIDDFQPLIEDKNIQLSLPQVEEQFVRGDTALLGQALANLLDNAIRYTPQGGLIDISVSPTADDQVALTITDSGPGIPEQYRKRVFERFNQGLHPDDEGSGLGLAIVAEIIHVHDGRVEALDAPGGGATIRMTLMRAGKAVVRKKKPEHPIPPG